MLKYNLHFVLLFFYIVEYAKMQKDSKKLTGIEVDIEPLNDGLVPAVSRNSQCQYPCNCPKGDMRCKAGVNLVKDGCDCCYMCARQQGDLCDYKDKCDEAKNLYCNFETTTGFQSTCRARDAKPCIIDGKTYKDGEEFKLGCRQLCTCQNGQYACSSTCPQEERPPSTTYCKYPRLIDIEGECCREWACQEHSLESLESNPSRKGSDWPSGEAMDNWGYSTAAPVERVKPPKTCVKEVTQWSPCSLTCGMGVSVRVTNENSACVPTQQRRLCIVRPCGLKDSHITGKKCKSTWKAAAKKITHGDCESVISHKLKYCSTCKLRKCCGPGRSKTVTLDFICADGHTTKEPFMWIKNCDCHRERNCPWA